MATCGTEQPWVSSLLDGSQRAERCAAEAQSRGGLCSGGLPHLELLGVDGAGAIGIEQVECLTDLLDLVIGETLGFGWSTARLQGNTRRMRIQNQA